MKHKIEYVLTERIVVPRSITVILDDEQYKDYLNGVNGFENDLKKSNSIDELSERYSRKINSNRNDYLIGNISDFDKDIKGKEVSLLDIEYVQECEDYKG